MIGFHVSALTRLAAGAAFCVGAVLMVWAVERVPATPPPAPALPGPATRTLLLTVESTYAVAEWSVLVLGEAQRASAAEAFSWRGHITAPVGEEVVVIAPAASSAGSPHRGLRLRLGDRPERLVWGEGDVVATETVP